jgi:hypothetical protein
MHRVPKTMRPRQGRPAAGVRSSERLTSSATRIALKASQNAQRNYERYLAFARAEAQAGNSIGAENYYQYAEHLFRSMRSTGEKTIAQPDRHPRGD